MQLKELCQHFQSRALFYPCAFHDIDTPIGTFLPYINEFWFADVAYNHRRRPTPNVARYPQESRSHFELTGQTIRRRLPYTIPVTSTVYSAPELGCSFKVNLCEGRGYDVFHTVFRKTGRKLSVFFHRGDSEGEGGSDFYWLSHYPHPRGRGKGMFDYVLNSIELDGLIVTDGSNAMPEFAKFHSNNNVGSECVTQCDAFEYSGRRFECVGYLGNRYGPTLVWTTNNS